MQNENETASGKILHEGGGSTNCVREILQHFRNIDDTWKIILNISWRRVALTQGGHASPFSQRFRCHLDLEIDRHIRVVLLELMDDLRLHQFLQEILVILQKTEKQKMDQGEIELKAIKTWAITLKRANKFGCIPHLKMHQPPKCENT